MPVNISDFVRRNAGYVVGAASAAGVVALLATSPEYQEKRRPDEFRRPELRLVDFTPIYGMYTESSRDLGTDSFSDWIDVNARLFRNLNLLDVVSIGTARWPREPEYFRTKLAVVAQDGIMPFYQLGFPELLVFANYLAHRKKHKDSQQKT